MKAVQPEMMAIRERYGDDKVKQQQALMELYKKEKINPLAGCLPILIQIPVFFALYKVLFVTIEMRHAPFFGWIKDLSAPDPTNLFNLFGLLPFDPTVLAGDRRVPASRRLADHHGRHDVGPDEAQSGAARPDAEDDLRLDAADLHLHAGELLGRPGDLLGLEQHALGAAAGLHHEQARRQDRVVGQHQGDCSGKKKDDTRSAREETGQRETGQEERAPEKTRHELDADALQRRRDRSRAQAVRRRLAVRRRHRRRSSACRRCAGSRSRSRGVPMSASRA